jgi:integrating conjugative element protein (TIGR03765 family)
MRQLSGLFVLFCLLLCLAAHAREPLTVIYDSGDTLPLEPYLPKRVIRETTTTRAYKGQLPFTLPITTPSMQPGKVKATPKALRYLQRPLFLVGADQLSKDWLAEKREQLIRLGAVGLLVEAKNQQEIQAVLAIAEGLRLVPASAEGFATRLGLSHYPILLSKEGWEQ